jgi:hypothetical protein
MQDPPEPFRPEYDSWWVEMADQTAEEKDPPILADNWSDPRHFDVDPTHEEVIRLAMANCVDLDF